MAQARSGSIDAEIVHGIPSPRRVLDEGSIVSVDVGVHLEGLHADSATTLPVGRVSPEAEQLLQPRVLYGRQGRQDEYVVIVERLKAERREYLKSFQSLERDIAESVS